jgi:hypothetical protein
MEYMPDREYFIELLERRRSIADVSEPIAVEKEEAIIPISDSYAQSV